MSWTSRTLRSPPSSACNTDSRHPVSGVVGAPGVSPPDPQARQAPPGVGMNAPHPKPQGQLTGPARIGHRPITTAPPRSHSLFNPSGAAATPRTQLQVPTQGNSPDPAQQFRCSAAAVPTRRSSSPTCRNRALTGRRGGGLAIGSSGDLRAKSTAVGGHCRRWQMPGVVVECGSGIEGEIGCARWKLGYCTGYEGRSARS